MIIRSRWVAPAIVVAALAGAACASIPTEHQFQVNIGRPAALSGELYRPEGEGQFPAVILLHGCGGLAPRLTRARSLSSLITWAEWLREEGYVAFVVDSFSGRNLRRICFDSTPLLPRDRSVDVFAAAAYLKTLPFVQADRIAAIGWSHGGSTVIWAGNSHTLVREVRLKALVAFYPGCGRSSRYTGSAPLLLLLGGQDDWTPPGSCQLLAQRAREEGRAVLDLVYANAAHGFDNARLPLGGRFIAGASRGRGATVAHNPEAHRDSEREVRRFLEVHLKR